MDILQAIGNTSLVRLSKVVLGWRTKNYVGTIFGGSMYAAGDGVYMVMLIKNHATRALQPTTHEG